MKRSVLIILLFAVLILSRIFFIDDKENIILYITIINSLSLIIVIITAIEDSYKLLLLEINNRKISNQLKSRYIKNIKKKEIELCLFTFFIFIGLLLSSEKYNDVFSIFTICVSILNKETSNICSKILKRWCRL